MSSIRSKQINDFNSSVTWDQTTSSEIPNGRDILNYFLPESSMIFETFLNQTISSSTGAWSLTLSYNVEDNNIALIVLYVNGVKYNVAQSISGTQVTFDTLPYDIEVNDELEVHYIKQHSI